MEPEKAEALPTNDRRQSELILIGDRVMVIYGDGERTVEDIVLPIVSSIDGWTEIGDEASDGVPRTRRVIKSPAKFYTSRHR